MFCHAKYRGGVRRTEGLENTDSGGGRVRSPLPLLIADEIGECPQGEGVKKYPQKKQRRILTFGGLERNIKNEYNR